MRYQKIIAAIFILCSLSTNIFAQNVEFDKNNFPDDKDGLKEAKKQLKQGDEYFEVGQGLYLYALEHYLSAFRFNPNNALLNYKIGACYLFTTEKARSIPYFLEAQNLNPDVSPDLNYLLGQAYHINYEFDEAIRRFKTYKQSLGPLDLQELSKIIEKKINECETGKQLVENPVRVFIDNIGSVINTSFPDTVLLLMLMNQ